VCAAGAPGYFRNRHGALVGYIKRLALLYNRGPKYKAQQGDILAGVDLCHYRGLVNRLGMHRSPVHKQSRGSPNQAKHVMQGRPLRRLGVHRRAAVCPHLNKNGFTNYDYTIA